uniref:long-chain-fatty-acid--CoA ligase n=1 Tax=Ditylenchus dipsaci TaxID=166011 RepID=A0A915E983_9BILA
MGLLSGNWREQRTTLGLLAATLVFSRTLPFWLTTLLLGMAYVAHRFGDFIYRSYLTLGRDLSGLALIIRVKLDLARRLRENRGIHQIFLDVVSRDPQKYVPSTLHLAGNGLSRITWLPRRRCGAMFMENCVEFVAAWMGLAKIGVVTAWINSNLKMQPLAHCLKASQAKAVICSDNLFTVLRSAREAGLLDQCEQPLVEFVYSHKKSSELPANAINLSRIINEKEGLEQRRQEPVPHSKEVNFKSILCFIYTSGTTGMPKAALMKHFRYYSMVMGSAESFGIYSTDRIYISMPLYHTSAGIIGVGQMLLRGSSCAIRQKFSASNFWKDCVKYECTASQYIGEICRYLLAQPVIKEEQRHKVRLLYGNGLRAEIWQEFVDRFGVKIGELYGSTEGTSTLVNTDGKVGSCGFLPISPLTCKLHPVRLLKVDEFSGEVLRANDGLCIPCKPGETGAMVSSIRKNNPFVFRKGDSAFLTGDILHWDRLGYVYFKDRTGDTFRWKGENVSTTEVEAVLQPIKSIIDVTVYGVEIKGMEGKAGMAAIVKDDESTQPIEEFLLELAQLLVSQLPAYAIPVFIRLCGAVDRTGTFKLVKTNLQRLGYSPGEDGASCDRLYIWEPAKKTYVPFDKLKRSYIENGDISRLL